MQKFSETERAALLGVHGVGPRVVARLEAQGIASLADLANSDAATICTHISLETGSTCWRNSPQARGSIQAAIDFAREIIS